MNPATPCVIFNPSARGDKARRFQSHADIFGGQCVMLATSSAGHARELAAQAVRNGFKTIIAAGGDGTANEVLNGIADVPGGLAAARLGILPLGTVNVFARELKIPLGPTRAWKILQQGRERTVDLGRAEFVGAHGPERRCFMQLAGAGLDTRAIELTEWRVKKKFGPLAYVLAGLKAMREVHPIITAQVDNGAIAKNTSQKPATSGTLAPPGGRGLGRGDPPLDSKTTFSNSSSLPGEWIAVGNGRYYGGPFAIFPKARMDDGLLDVCVFPKVSLARTPALIAGFLFGLLPQLARVKMLAASKVTLTSPTPVTLQLDGENVGRLPATLSVEPKMLRVIVP